MYRVKYLNRVTGGEYWRTVVADTPAEAARLAKRYERRGFIYVTIKRKD